MYFCLTSLNPCILKSWEKWFLLLATILLESVTKSPFIYCISSRQLTLFKVIFCTYTSLWYFWSYCFKFRNFSFQIFLLLFLKCLLDSRLTLCKLSKLFWLASCTHCSLASFLWSKKVNTRHQTMFYAASIRADLDSLSEVLYIFFNALPNPIYVPAFT